MTPERKTGLGPRIVANRVEEPIEITGKTDDNSSFSNGRVRNGKTVENHKY